MQELWIIGIIAAAIGTALGYVGRKALAKHKKDQAEFLAEKIVTDAKNKSREVLLEAKDQALQLREVAKKEELEKRKRLDQLEMRLSQKEEALDDKFQKIEEVQGKLEEKGKQLQGLRTELEQMRELQQKKLEQIASMTKEEARDSLLTRVEQEAEKELLARMEKVESEVREEAGRRTREILAHSIQKYAGDVVGESTVTIVTLPSDEMKGRIIGREGRNIHAFEKITGVDVIVDDSPGTIVISGFDLVRRYVAKLAMEKLIVDGRIHPTRIEEAVEKSKKEVAKLIKDFGEKVVYETGVTGLHPDLIKMLGRLRFRTAYGQNVLKHSAEVTYIASALAEELGADVTTVKRGALLHDIGKTVDHKIEGSHSQIGRDIAKKYGMSAEVTHAIEAHAGEVPCKTVEAIIVQVANQIANSRPGAQREALESHIKRLGDIEAIAKSFEGVEKAFAIQAGREVRVVVEPKIISDLESAKLARSIARKIEQDLKYPGQIKVNVVRETRLIEYAK